MDKSFNTENFEKSLKTHTDDFKMMPSKKVWRGIYNDLHPGTRWPSIAMSLVFIFTLVIIGHLNTNNAKILAALNTPRKITVQGNILSKNKHKTHTLHFLSDNIKSSKTNIADNFTEPIAKAGEYVFSPFHQVFNKTSSGINVSDTILNSTDNVMDPNPLFPAKKQYDVIIKDDDRNFTI